ncbi:MAG TPA: hypothetical protein VF395_14900, partial [Polyangiaceae bacterium]
MPAFVRGTTWLQAVAALRGAHGIVTIGHVGALDPRLAVVNADGERVGEVTKLMETGDSPLFSCLALVPTLEAGAASVLANQDGTMTWKLTEVRADGSVAQQVALDSLALASTCPIVTPSKRGLTVGLVTVEGDLHPYSVVDGLVAELTAPISPNAFDSGVRFLTETMSGLRVFASSEGRNRMANVGPDGDVNWIEGDLPAGVPIASEAGALFLLVTSLEEPRNSYIAE